MSPTGVSPTTTGTSLSRRRCDKSTAKPMTSMPSPTCWAWKQLWLSNRTRHPLGSLASEWPALIFQWIWFLIVILFVFLFYYCASATTSFLFLKLYLSYFLLMYVPNNGFYGLVIFTFYIPAWLLWTGGIRSGKLESQSLIM